MKADFSSTVIPMEQTNSMISLATLLHVLGYLSILGSIMAWYFASGSGSPEAVAHGERFGIFVGLWAPTFFVLSMKSRENR